MFKILFKYNSYTKIYHKYVYANECDYDVVYANLRRVAKK